MAVQLNNITDQLFSVNHFFVFFPVFSGLFSHKTGEPQ